MSSDEFPDQPFTRSDLPELGLTPAPLRCGLAHQEVRRVLRAAVEYDGLEFRRTEEQVRHDERLERWLRDLRGALATPYTNLRW